MFAVLLALCSLVYAQFNVYADRTSYSASDNLLIKWAPASNTVIDLTSLTLGEVLLCTCNSTELYHCTTIATKLDISAQNALSMPISSLASDFPSGTYMIQFVSINPHNKGMYAIAYSRGWFTLSGMTGGGVAQKGCNVPTNNDVNVPGTATSSTVTWSVYTVPSSLSIYLTTSQWLMPFEWQIGGSRYAPPQSIPGTKVTQTVTPTRRFPESSWTAYQSFLFTQLPLTTATPVLTTATQYYNYATTIATTPSGRAMSRALPSVYGKTASADRKRRWAQ